MCIFAFVQEAAEVIALPELAERLGGAPSAALDPMLDATVECLSRHGLSKSTLSDIARELGVAPSTVYRRVGSVENAAMLVMAREGHRLMQAMPEVIAGVEGPRVITVFLAESIRRTASHPMVSKILRDEVDWVGRLVTRRLEDMVQQSAATTAPLLESAMVAGHIRTQDADALAHWIARVAMICLFVPPPGDLQDALDALLLPMLDPDRRT